MSEHQNKDEGRKVNANADTVPSPAISRKSMEELIAIAELAQAACESYNKDVKAIGEMVKGKFDDESMERFIRAKGLLYKDVYNRNDIPDLAKDKIAALPPELQKALRDWYDIKTTKYEEKMNKLEFALALGRRRQLIAETLKMDQK